MGLFARFRGAAVGGMNAWSLGTEGGRARVSLPATVTYQVYGRGHRLLDRPVSV